MEFLRLPFRALQAAAGEEAAEPRTGRALAAAVVAALALGPLTGPSSAQPVGSGFVYTADELGGSVSEIDLATGQVETVALPISPHNIQISPDGRRLLAVGSPVADGGEHGEEAEHEEEMEGHGMAVENDGPAGLLVVLDPDKLDAGPLAAIPVGDHPAHVVVTDDGRALVTNSGANEVAVVDLATGEVVARINTGRYPHGLRISPDGRQAYVAAVEEGAVSVLDIGSLTEAARIPVGAAPVQVGFTPDGARVYVSLRDENAVAVIDTATRQVIARIPVGRNPIQVYATPDGTRVYVANQGTEEQPDNTVSVIDVATNVVADTITTAAGAHGVAVSADGELVFVTNIADDSVSVIDEASRKVIRTLRVGDGPNGVTYRPAGG